MNLIQISIDREPDLFFLYFIYLLTVNWSGDQSWYKIQDFGFNFPYTYKKYRWLNKDNRIYFLTSSFLVCGLYR